MASTAESQGIQDVLLDRDTRLALDDIFECGYRGPCAADRRAPSPHTVVAFNLPRKCVPLNARGLYDIFASIGHHNRDLNAYTKLLGMLSMAATRPVSGFGDQSKPGTDRRGEVYGNGDALLFEHMGNYYERTEQCIEDLVSENGAVIGHRFWLFVMDPGLNLGEALRDVARTNQVIYNSAGTRGKKGVPESDPYVHHAQVTSDSSVLDLFSVYVRDGLESCSASQMHERAHFRGLERSLMSVANGTNRNGGSLVDKHSQHHPASVLSPSAAFVFHLTSVCEQQRDIENYFTLAASEYDADVDDGGGGGGALSAEQGDADADEDSMDLAAEELRAAQVQSGLASGRAQQEEGDYDEGGDAGGVPAALRWSPDASFLQFPKPKLVQRIPVILFGRKLLNVPLRAVFSLTGARSGVVDMDSVAIEHIVDKLELGPEFLAPDAPATSRRSAIEKAYDMFVTPWAAAAAAQSEVYFDLSEQNPDYGCIATCRALLRRIYRAFLVDKERKSVESRTPILREKLRASTRVIFKPQTVVGHPNEGASETTAFLGDSDGDVGFAGSPQQLPELNQEEGLSRVELEEFAKEADLLKLRIENHARYNEVITSYRYGTEAFDEAMKEFRAEACERFWEVFNTSSKVSDTIEKARGFFHKLDVKHHWPDHHVLHREFSAFSNLMMLYISRYNQVYRGASTQTIFLLLWTSAINSFMYQFGLRPNILLTGDGGAGKSFPIDAAADLMVPGGFSIESHVTPKAFTGNKPYRDFAFAMHEASRNFIGVDEKGFDNSGDPIFKDILTRNRSSSKYFHFDEAGTRLAIESSVLAMFNVIFATNDAVPAEEKALMQRFINVPVHYTKRVGFNKGDQSHVSSNEVNGVVNDRHRRQSRVFSFYCLVTEKMVEAFVIPEPSTDCANTYMREILNLYTRNTGIDTGDARKRTMVKHLMRTGAVMNAVHTGLCTALSWEHRSETSLEGKRVVRPFHPQMIVDHVMPRMYVTDDIAVFYLTMCAFMWEPRNQWFILDTVVSVMNDAPQNGRPLTRKTCSFRMVKNENYYRQQQRKRSQNYDRMRRRRAASPAAFAVGGAAATEVNYGDADAEEGDEVEEPEFLPDTNYVVVSGSTSALIYNKISQEAVGSRPSVNEIRRVMYRMSRAYRAVHRTYLQPVVDDEDGDEPRFSDTRQGKEEEEEDEEDEEDEDMEDLEDDPELAATYGGAVATIGASTAAARAQTARSQNDVYQNETFRWMCADSEPPLHEKLPIVRIETDPRARNGSAVLCVLIEALKDGSFQNGIKNATREFMECSNVPAEGRRVVTCYDYAWCENGRVVEHMPQYKEVLDLKRRDRKMRVRHLGIGTLDSNAFMTSSLSFDPGEVNPGQLISSNALATEYRDPPNVYFAKQHWRACRLLPGDEWYHVLPETDARKILCLQDRAIAEGTDGGTIKYVYNYPHKQARHEIRQREVRDMFEKDPQNEAFDNFIVSDEDYHRISALAELVEPLPYAHIDYATGTVVVADHATPTQRREIEAIKQRADRMARSLSVLQKRHATDQRLETSAPTRDAVHEDGAAPPHATCAEKKAHSVHSYNKSFTVRLQSLYETLSDKKAPEKSKKRKRGGGSAGVAKKAAVANKRLKKSKRAAAAADWSVVPGSSSSSL